MTQALAEALRALEIHEVPVGAIIVSADGTIIGRGFNHPISTHDPTGHAEIFALREAARRVGNYRLTGMTMYCTLEPCIMCAGAIVHARIGRLVFGAYDPKAGAAGSIYNVLADSRLNHQPQVVAGVLEPQCRQILQEFFQWKRKL
jgi:tRNA(adenine34) deaminase